MNDVQWPEMWDTVLKGFYEHERKLHSMLDEWTALREQGYGDPLDGFISTALHAHEWEIRELNEATEQKDADGILQVLTRVVAGIARYYSEAELGWSVTWETYHDEYDNWLHALRQYVELGHHDKEAFLDYTTRRWRT